MPAVAFDQPWCLLALLLLPLVWWVGSKSLVDLERPRRVAALILRSLLVVCLALARAGTQIVRQSGANCTLFVIDASYSVSRAERQRALDFVNQSVRNMREADKVGVLTVGPALLGGRPRGGGSEVDGGGEGGTAGAAPRSA